MSKALDVYSGLLDLSSQNNGFYYKDFIQDDRIYRVFDYHLVSWSGFQKPYAKHCRGITYDITAPENPVLVSLPMDKFFNYTEGGIDHSNSELLFYMEKLDGSLVSSYLHNGKLQLKTKSSLFSDQATAAMNWLSLPENADYYNFVVLTTERNQTVNFEWVSPNNRIVVPYQEEKLTIINIRDMNTFETSYPTEHPYYVKNVVPEEANIEKVVQATYDNKQGEGIVLVLKSSDDTIYHVKVKTHLYTQLHGLNDSINNPAKLAELIIDGSIDDMRQKFIGQSEILKIIDASESKVVPIYNNLIKETEAFYDEYKHLDRKSYAQNAHAELGKKMVLAMGLYLGAEPKYKEFSLKNLKYIYDI